MKTKRNYLIIKFIIFIIICQYSTAGEFSVPENKNFSFDDFLNTPSQYPSCSQEDYYWSEQSGADHVEIPVVESSSVVLNADKITAQEGKTYYALGDVMAYNSENTLLADWVIYDQKVSRVTGGDNIKLTRGYDIMTGSFVDYYIDINKGTIKKGTALQKATNIFASGEEIDIYNQEKYKIKKGYLTSCDPNNPAWHIRAQEATFDYQNNLGTARGAAFYAESIPIAYLPYLQFPLGKRQSGFIVPVLGKSGGNSGYYLGLPYYWNMAPNYDMTITPILYSDSGFMLADEFRYLTESGFGQMFTQQMPSDWNTGQYRYYWSLEDRHDILQDVHVGYDYNYVSDSSYFNDFGNFVSVVNNYNLDQSVFVNYTPSWGLFGVKAQQYQTIQPPGIPKVAQIYAKAPEVRFNINQQQLGKSNLQAGLISQYTDFAGGGGSLQVGQRVVAYPDLTLVLENNWGFLKPRIGYNYTHYQLAPFFGLQNDYSTFDRSLPIVTVDSGLIFERPASFFSTNYVQTIEPRLYYVYIPEVNQSNIPMFDTAPATFNIDQLFLENRFSGFDRINMANNLTIGASSKLINDNNGIEVANWGIAYRYKITPENQFIYGDFTRFPVLYQPRPDLILELNNNWARSISTNASFQYDTVFGNIDAYVFKLSYNPEDYKVINARFSYQYNLPTLFYNYTPGQVDAPPPNYENQYALDLSGQWPLFSNHWLLEGRINYDFTMNKFLNYLGGIEYNGGCWSVRLLAENYVTNIYLANNQPKYTTTYMLQVTLTGLTNIGFGGDPIRELNINVPGYVPIVKNSLGY